MFDVEFCIVEEALPKAELVAELVSITQSKRWVVWRTFDFAQPVGTE